jgi:hypothetical protein
MRLLDFDDGFTTENAPDQGSTAANSLRTFASDAAFVTNKGTTAANGDIYYNTTDNAVRIYRNGAWEYLRQPTVTGTRASPQSIIAASGVTFSGKQQDNLWFVKGSSGAVTVSANPQVAVGNYVGQKLRVFGTNDTDTLKLSHGTGLSLLGADVILTDGDSIEFIWDGTNWAETGRSA